MLKLLRDYRPELHYMRGPGPKWREKHCRTDRTDPAFGDPSKAAACCDAGDTDTIVKAKPCALLQLWLRAFKWRTRQFMRAEPRN